MTVQLNTAIRTLPSQSVQPTEPAALKCAAVVTQRPDSFHATPVAVAAQAATPAVSARSLGFEAREVSSAAAPSATPAYDAAGDLFRGSTG